MTTIIAFFRELLIRLNQTSPSFFKTLKVLSVIFGVLIGAFMSVAPALGVDLSGTVFWGLATWTEFLAGVIVFLAGIFSTSATTVKDTNKLESKLK